MKILDHYIRKNVIFSTLIVLSILLAIQCFLGFVSEVSVIGKGNYGLMQSLEYVLLTLPYNLYQIFPMLGFIGCLLGLGKLASDRELLVMRTAGVSVNRIIWSVIKATLIMVVFMTIIGEWVGPQLNYWASNIKQEALQGKTYNNVQNSWLRDKDSYIFINTSSNSKKIENVVIYHFNPQHQLLSALHAKYGEWVNKNWELHDINKTIFSKNAIYSKYIDHQIMHFNFKPAMERNTLLDPDNETVTQLMRNIIYRTHAGLLSNEYQLMFWQRVVRPLTTLVLVCLAVPFVFGSLRNASWGLRVLIGVLVGFSFVVLNEIFGPIIMVYQVSPALGALLPSFVFMLVYLLIFKRSRL